ncbi:MAG: hypothetical protein A3G08_02700 [Candidatus Magasanikbacteria bacterium RIFCSPLOWO2_12_FULL_47_9b]|nr:MAG: hypothetical protein A3I74_00245 [Candidatus Magasanikbacteria bacterium RIFCSPLOWO2_02_FULL_47_16]OGH80116.1 MAG: hypothetical protein A3C10_02985 [Candidatus Magasanikbacteria bacterium RIFCSPHIGHO2_02_FULL_48_18]OGH83195.1 MAG: hypothetical protein A3G08_02700 [Candidatus Magasanikbacteria bacterium RIFCSPLOWO2_12_FULL_47_9b]
MKQLGVRVVFCPSYWYKEIAGEGAKWNSTCEEDHIDALCRTRALENNIMFIYANAAGVMKFPNGTVDTLIGHSQITLPIVGPVAKTEHNNETMIVHTVDLSILDIGRKEYWLV